MTYYVIDRFEGKTAVIVADDGTALNVPRERLPRGCREGTVLRIDTPGPPDWSQAIIDETERARRIERARDTLRRLSGSDPGGDIVL